MAKAADVEILQAEVTCPGKFVILVAGELSAVRASVDVAAGKYSDKVMDTFVLGNPHESIFPAIYGTAQPEKIEALGILETYDVAALIVAADLAAKTAIVDLIELRLAKGMCGKSYMTLIRKRICCYRQRSITQKQKQVTEECSLTVLLFRVLLTNL